MQHKVKKVIPEHVKEGISHVTCDICKKRFAAQTEISFREVEMSYPECGSGVDYSYDICEGCFKEKVIPALSELGAEPRIEEWGY